MSVTSPSSGGTGSASANTLTVDGLPGLVAGRLIVFVLHKRNSESISTPSGFTQVESTFNSTGSVQVASFWKILTSDDVSNNSFTFSWTTASRCDLSWAVFRNFDPSNPVSAPVESTVDNSASPTFTGTSLTPTITGSAIIIAQSSNQNSVLLDIFSGHITCASNTISYLAWGSTDNNSTLNSAVYAVTLGTPLGATGNFSFNSASATSDWAMHAFIINAADPAVVTAFSVTNTSDGSIASQVSGTPFNIKIKAINGLGDTVTSYTGTVDITSSGELSTGSGTTAAFTSGVLSSHEVEISNFGTFTITATKTGDTETGTSNSFNVTGDLNIQKHRGNIYYPVKIFPTLSNIKHVNIIMAPISGISGTQKEAAIKFYFNMSSTPSMTKYITRDEIARGYASFEINKQYINSMQMEVEYFNEANPSPDNDWSNIGVADFCPAYAEIIYERTTTLK